MVRARAAEPMKRTPSKPNRTVLAAHDQGALDEWAAELEGRVLNGRYRVEKPLGFGMTGGVFRGTRIALNKAVAIKILHEELGCNPNIRSRFEREALMASKLEHIGCVAITDVDEDEELSYFVMPLVEGVELCSALGNRLTPEVAVSIADQLLDALHHAHSWGIVHRDVKPENVLVVRGDGEPWVVKLLDFGIAKARMPNDKKRLTTVGTIFGTPQYMSPEQARGDDATLRSDLYSTGLILYEMLMGTPAFDGDDVLALVHRRITASVPPMDDHVPPALAAVVAGLTAHAPEDRYTDASEARRALTDALRPAGESSPSLADTDPPPASPSSVGTEPVPVAVPEASPESAAIPTPVPTQASGEIILPDVLPSPALEVDPRVPVASSYAASESASQPIAAAGSAVMRSPAPRPAPRVVPLVLAGVVTLALWVALALLVGGGLTLP
ncbi:MAG: protein kinase [Myxococcota bacterium]